MIARYGENDYGYSEAGYGYGVSAFRGVFDGLTLTASFLGAWSFSRRLWSGVNVPLFRARRAVDSAERDWFGTGPQGEVSIVEFQSWCSGGDAFAVTLYDQSGLARNFAQSTTTIQPILAESGTAITENGRLAAKFVAADARRMSIASSTAMFNALHTTGGTILCVSKCNDTAAAKAILSSASSSTGAGFRMTTGSNEVIGYSTGRLDVAGVATAGNSIVLNGANSQASSLRINAAVLDPDNGTAASRISYWENGTQGASTNAQTGTPFVENASDNMTLGATAAGGSPHDGTFCEGVFFSSLISTADRTAYQSRSGTFFTVTIA